MLLVREKTYSISEFLGYLNDKDIDILDREVRTGLEKLDVQIEKYLYNPKTRTMLVTVTACLANTVTALAGVAEAKSKMRSVGQEIFGLCQETAFWISLIMCAIEIIRALISGDRKSVTGIVAKYLIGFGALFFLPWLFELIRDIFS